MLENFLIPNSQLNNKYFLSPINPSILARDIINLSSFLPALFLSAKLGKNIGIIPTLNIA